MDFLKKNDRPSAAVQKVAMAQGISLYYAKVLIFMEMKPCF